MDEQYWADAPWFWELSQGRYEFVPEGMGASAKQNAALGGIGEGDINKDTRREMEYSPIRFVFLFRI